MSRPHPSSADSSDASPVSKTRRKRDMEALQDLGARLVELDATRLASLDLPERLIDAVALARRTTRHEARRRQMQYIGRLMRDIDPAPLQAALARWAEGPAQERAQFAALERWRTRLLDDDAGVAEFIAAYPQTDRALLVRLVAEAREERRRGGPPHHQRALFRALKTAVHSHA